jgi:hypothetical protein
MSAVRPELDANFALVINDEYWAKRGNVGALRFSDYPDSIFTRDERLRKILPNAQATFKGPVVRPAAFAPPMQPAVLYFPEGSRDAFPVVATGEHGQGRVVYFAAGIDAALFSYAFPYQRVLLSTAVKWAAQTPYPITVDAPMCVQSTFWKKPNGRLIIHLWNGLNTTSDHGQQDVETPLREEAVAIHGIQIRVKSLAFRSARCEPEGIVLQVRPEGDCNVIAVPPVRIHCAIVLEP